MIFTARDNPDSTDIFQKEYLREVWELQSQIENEELLYKNSLYTVDSYCYKPVKGKGCYIASPMDYWKMNITALNEDPDIKYTAQCTQQIAGEQIVCSDRNEIPIIRNVVFGGVKCEAGTSSDCEACKITAKAMMVTFLLMNDSDAEDIGVEDWESDVFEKKIDDFNDDDHLLTISYLSERSIPDELQEESNQNMAYVIGSYCAMFLYISIAIGYFPSRLHTRFMLGFSGILVVICSVLIAVGLTSALGIGLSMISMEVVPFLILAIGVDNMFIISMCERKAHGILKKEMPPGEEPPHDEVMALALEEAGPTITTAAISEFAAFIVGTSTGVPALTNFCITAALAVLGDYLLQVTAFVSVLELDYRRRRGGRLDCLPCFDLENIPPEPKRDFVRSFVKKYFIPVIFYPVTQVTLLLIFVLLIILSFGAYDNLDLGLTPQVSSIKHSDLYDFFDDYEDYGKAGSIAYVVFKEINYTNTQNQQVMDHISDALSQMTDTVQPPVYSWLKNFQSYLNNREVADICNSTNINYYDFNTQVKKFLTVPIESTCCKKYGICGEQYSTDIIFNDDGNIKASRFRFQHTALKSQTDYILALRNARHAVDQLSGNLVPAMYGNPDMENYALVGASKDWESSDDSYLSEDRLAFAYSLFYVYYDQYDSIRGIAIQNLLLSFAVVFFAIELITNLYASAIVTMLVAGTTWALIGLCYVWNKLGGHYETEVNAVSVVNLVMCVGLAVEFSIHIMTSFLKQTGSKPERAKRALLEMGSTVLTGIITTKLIGVIVLGLAPSMVFTLYYFRMYLCIIGLGFFHGLAFQPIVLSYIGPPSVVKPKRSRRRSMEQYELHGDDYDKH